MLYLLLSAVESSAISAPPPVLHRQHMQHIAMFALLTQKHSLSSMINDHVCTWVGVTCVKAAVTEICWIAPLQRSGPRIMDIRWIPQSVTAIILSEQKVVRPFEARALPRDLQICRMCSCGVYGTIDMHDLPRDMKEFIVKYNQISGKISLLNLPPDLRALKLEGNKIAAIYGREGCPQWLYTNFRYGQLRIKSKPSTLQWMGTRGISVFNSKDRLGQHLGRC